MFKRCVVAACVGLIAQGAYAEPSWSPTAKFELGMALGGRSSSSYYANLGTTYLVQDRSIDNDLSVSLPVTGVRLTSGGVDALVFGTSPARERQTNARSGSTGFSWGWVAAGVGTLAVAGVALAGGGGKKTVNNGSSNNQTNCGVGDNGGVIPDVDLNCGP